MFMMSCESWKLEVKYWGIMKFLPLQVSTLCGIESFLSEAFSLVSQIMVLALRWCVLRIIQTVLSVFKTSLFSFSHLLRDSRSSFKVCSSTHRSVSEACKVVWSAYKSNISLIASGAPFINITNNKGPRMDPYGTPIVTDWSSERVCLKLTCCIRLDKYDLDHSTSLPSTP